MGILSACLPTFRPLFTRSSLISKFKLGSGTGNSAQEKSSDTGGKRGRRREKDDDGGDKPFGPDTPSTFYPDSPVTPQVGGEVGNAEPRGGERV